MFKRVGLFLLTNLAVLALVSVVMSILGVNPQQFGGLLIFAALFGFGGAFFSLLISKWMAKRATGAHVIETPRNEAEQWLLSTVQRQAQAAGIGMPEVAIYDAPEINAFATGANRNKALVAVSTGLLRAMDRDEAEAVLGHEVSHVANGDMVTMALLQGVLNTFVIVLARVVGRVIDGYLSGGRDGPGLGYYAIVFVLDMVFGLFASMIAMWFSRHREFRALRPRHRVGQHRALEHPQHRVLGGQLRVRAVGRLLRPPRGRLARPLHRDVDGRAPDLLHRAVRAAHRLAGRDHGDDPAVAADHAALDRVRRVPYQ